MSIRKTGFVASAEGYGDLLRILVDANNEGGNFEVTATKPWHSPTILPRVHVPEGPCGVLETVQVEMTIELLPGAPQVRQVVAPPYDYGFGGSVCGRPDRIAAYVVAIPEVSQEVVWISRDTTLVKITGVDTGSDGSSIAEIIPVCRADSGVTHIIAMAAADTTVRDSVSVSVGGRER
ncbi:MAG TPA: hypothetical protein VMN39_09340 [Longimicrobiaceae bacterium]|nr:hypothetical protein [Longimicrobiaceae bacterium]